MKSRLIGIALLLSAGTAANAQDLYESEVMVTGSRGALEQANFDTYDSQRPAVGLRRTADFLVQEVAIRGDTRDPEQRGQEIRAMLDDAVRRASGHGVELSFGESLLTDLTADNIDELTLQPDSRPDSERINFLVKARLGPDQSAADAERRIAAFIEAVPERGRAQMDEWGDSSLSVVGPDSYRDEIITAITADAAKQAAKLGDGYAVQIGGMNTPVQWARAGLSEVLLYIPYSLLILPRP
jgi:hypothetical protein